MSCNAILGQYENGDPIRCEEPLDPRAEWLHSHQWARDRVTGFFRGQHHEFRPYPRLLPETGSRAEIAEAKAHNEKARAEKAEHERKMAERLTTDATRHPDIEWVPMSSEKFNRPPDPPKSAEQLAQEEKQKRYDALRAKGRLMTLAERTEAAWLAFELGIGPPPAA